MAQSHTKDTLSFTKELIGDFFFVLLFNPTRHVGLSGLRVTLCNNLIYKVFH